MRKWRVLAVAACSVVTVAASAVFAQPAFSHGYTGTPVSRALHCKQGTVTGCGPIQWEPQSVEGPKGFPNAGPADGKICAAGDSRWAPLDDPRGGAWPATQLSSGAPYTFRWTLTAAHATTSFRYFVTRNGWTPNQPLSRAQLDLNPFLTVNYGGAQPPGNASHAGTLPAGKSGRHMILAVWDIADTGNAFYQCSDVTF